MNLKNSDLKFVTDAQQRLFAIDLRASPRVDEILELTINFTPDDSLSKSYESNSSEQLTFDAQQLQRPIRWLNKIGAWALARRLAKLQSIRALEIAELFKAYGDYTLDEEYFSEDEQNFSDFVQTNARINAQCHMTVRFLDKIMELALQTHPLRARYRLQPVCQTGVKAKGPHKWTLTLPLHSTLEILFDGKSTEVLDGTPALPERFVQVAAIEKSMNQSSDKLIEGINKIEEHRKAVATAIRSLGRRAVDPSLPIIDINLALRHVLALARASIGENQSWDEIEFRNNLRPWLGTQVDDTNLSTVLLALDQKLLEWNQRLDELAKRSKENRDPRFQKYEQALGVTVLLDPAVTVPLTQATREASFILKSCSRYLAQRQADTSRTP